MIKYNEEKGLHEDESLKLVQCSKEPTTNLHQCDENHNVEPYTIWGVTGLQMAIPRPEPSKRLGT
jgi:hypothetical protein